MNRGQLKGRPLEEGSRPVINGLFANLSAPPRKLSPPPKECFLTDDIFVAQAELRALEALNTKLTSELCAIEERGQQMEIDRRAALSECESLRERERVLREQVTNARRDAAKAGADATCLEEEMRRAASARIAADARVKEAVEAGLREQTAREIDSRETVVLRRDFANALRVAGEREREIKSLRAEIERSRADQRKQNDKFAQICGDNERLREDVETEKAWREQAQRDAVNAARRANEAEISCAQAKDITVRLRRTSKVAISEASAIRDECARLRKEAPEGPHRSLESSVDWRRRCREGRERENLEKKRADVLYYQLKAERDRVVKADKDAVELKSALDRAQRAVRHERQRVNRLQCGVNHPSLPPPTTCADGKRQRPRRNDDYASSLPANPEISRAQRESKSAGCQTIRPPRHEPPLPRPQYSDVPCFLRDDNDDEVNRAVQAYHGAKDHDDSTNYAPATDFEADTAVETKIITDLDNDIPLCFRVDSGDEDFDFDDKED